ncbi:MAG: hypothetical protein OHK0046_46500 [Anaerolineae bacterium]
MVRMNSQAVQLSLVKPHVGGQRAVYRHPARFQVVACGRRWGKTEFGKLATYEGLLKYRTDVWWIAPTYKMSSVIWREFRRALKPLAAWVSAAERVVEMPAGNTLTVWTADAYDTMRGGAPGLVIVDEAAMIRDFEDMWFAVIRPALTDKQGRGLFLSSPRGRNGFWKLYTMGIDPLFPEYKSWNFPSWLRPNLPAGEIEEAQRTLPARFFDQEYGAAFLDDAGGVFRGVAAVARLDVRPPYPGRFIFGVDWGRVNDFTVVSVIDADSRQQVDIERFNQIGWGFQRERLRMMVEKWQPAVIWAEENSIGSPNIEALQAEGLPVRPFQTTAATKPPLIEGLALAIERQEIGLLNDRVQTAELQAYEVERTRSNLWRYSAPEGAHDDTVMALALAWHGCTAGAYGNVFRLPR